jgi:CheY-like chemotaxis protein
MPVMNGWQLLSAIQENPKQQDIPVIVLTAFTDASNRMEGQLQGVKAYLDKPVTPHNLRTTVQRVLGVKS